MSTIRLLAIVRMETCRSVVVVAFNGIPPVLRQADADELHSSAENKSQIKKVYSLEKL